MKIKGEERDRIFSIFKNLVHNQLMILYYHYTNIRTTDS